MKKTIVPLFCALFGLSLVSTSCQDMLTPELDRYTEKFSGKDTVNFYFGILNNMQDMIEQNVLLGELRGDLVNPTEYASDSINDIINFTNLQDGENRLLDRSAYYKVINQCNFYLARVDSMALRNNSYFMRRELAQVQLMRAWTYMQLVQNYGRVPFITRPVDNSDTGWDKNPPEGWVTPTTLLATLEEKGGLKQAYAYTKQYGYPDYGEFNNGASKFKHKVTLFNANVLYGDLYLLRGADKSDYEKAAAYYYEFLDEDTRDFVRTDPARIFRFTGSTGDTYGSYVFIRNFIGNDGLSVGEVQTSIPSASNSFFGHVLTRVPQIYGFDATSSNQTTTEKGTGDDGKDKTTTSGAVQLEANYRNRQVEPSVAYTRLNAAQTVVYNETENGKISNVRYPDLFDARYDATAPLVVTDQGRLRFIQKFNPSSSSSSSGLFTRAFTFRYGIPVYRIRQIYLRYAEAINRAGYPRYAFDILRSGLYARTMPLLLTEERRDTVYTDSTRTQIKEVLIGRRTNIYEQENGALSIDLSSMLRAGNHDWLDFSGDAFSAKPNRGIHEAGCGQFSSKDSMWVYDKVVAQRIFDEAARQGKPLSKVPVLEQHPTVNKWDLSREENVTDDNGHNYRVRYFTADLTPATPTEAEIAAMETLIADELALETAFEGYRFFDLMRIQRHRNNAGDETVNNSWLAWLISRRNVDLKPYENPATKGPLYDKLLNEENWYLPAPANR